MEEMNIDDESHYSEPRDSFQLIGWREWVTLPLLAPEPIEAKIDTGARSCCLHAGQIEIASKRWVSFQLLDRECHLPLAGVRVVTTSTGRRERRPVVLTTVRLHGIAFEVDFTLRNRSQLQCPVLIGRSALRGRFLVDPSSP